MNAAGVIVEFNPFHNGHAEHLRETRIISGREKIIAVMSGNFVQRGEPAICDKWRRTKMALLSGVDIVIEIPVPYVISGADYFARGSVGLLAATGVVDALSFGSECGDIEAIKEAGAILAEEPVLYKETLRGGLDAGLSFAAARGAALEKCMKNTSEGLFTKPNNGLATEYCKALKLLKSRMEVFTTHRKSGGASATKIRASFLKNECVKNFMPHDVFEILQDAQIATLNDYSEIFRYLLYSRDFELGEGLENRFKLHGDFKKISDFISAVKTKRYTYTRIQRAVMGIILGITAPDNLQYLRVLGFRRESADLLGELTKKATLPVITNGAATDTILSNGGAAGVMLAKELEAGDIYKCAAGASGGYRNERAAGLVII
jgi:predicted nucleotidyltransferase